MKPINVALLGIGTVGLLLSATPMLGRRVRSLIEPRDARLPRPNESGAVAQAI